MSLKLFLLTTILFFGFLTNTNANSNCNLDSLISELNKKQDNSRYETYNTIIDQLLNTPDTALYYAKQAFELASSENNKKEIGNFLHKKGLVYERLGMLNEAITDFKLAFNIYEELEDTSNAANSLINLGAVLVENSEYEEASIYLFKALKFVEENNLVNSLSKAYHNIGLLFYNQQEYEKSIDYYTRTIPIREKQNDLKGLALTYNNIGISYYFLSMFDSVLINFERSLEMYIKLGDKLGQTRPLSNIGEIYYSLGDYDKALEYYNRSINIEKEIGYKLGYVVSLFDIGSLYAETGQFDKAVEYQYLGLQISKELGVPGKLMDAYENLYNLYDKYNMPDSALKYYVLLTQIKDSLFTIERIKTINELESIYNIEKKEQQIALQKIIIRNHKIRNGALSIILILILGIVIQILRINRNKKKTNMVLEEKNTQLAENNRQITSSITYASVIQAAILPPLKLIKEIFPDYFVVFRPKDIVSGDFYWMTKSNEKIVIAIADCTGHGVPGAFMSMLGMTFLNEIINIQSVDSTAEILNELRKKVINALRQRNSQYDTRDGMDISLCSINLKSLKLEYSGSYLPLLIHSHGIIEKIEGDKMPIGYHKTRKGSFTLNTEQLNKGDIIYMYTDGFIDQFGGEEGKKYSRQKFTNFILSIAEHPLHRQGQKMEIEFDNWKGQGDQIDDITIFGIKI